MKLTPDFFSYTSRSYRESQINSARLDDLLGLNILEIEKQLVHKAMQVTPSGNIKSWGPQMHNGAQSWVGLGPEQLQTNYDEFVEIINYINPSGHQTWLDLGAGYGRLGMVLHSMKPEVEFIGYEIVKERVAEGNRIFEKFGIKNSRLYCQNLTNKDFKLPKAHCYFIYDYGKIEHMKQTLEQISEYATTSFFLVARGRVRDFIYYHHPWLTVETPYQTKTFTIYKFKA